MKRFSCSRVSALLALLTVCSFSYAAPITVPCTPSGCLATITQGPNNGTNGDVNYTIQTLETGSSFVTTFTTADPTALDFANVYFDTDATTVSGSNLGFEITNNRAFIPSNTPGPYYSLTGTGITESDTLVGTTRTIQLVIPNSFFLTDPTGIPFTTTTPGDEVTVHYSQSFGYDMVGGSNNYSLPNELGGAVIPGAVTPEPSTFVLLGTGIVGVFGAARRRFLGR